MQANVTIKMSVDEAMDIKRALTGELERTMELIKPLNEKEGQALRNYAGRLGDLLWEFGIE